MARGGGRREEAASFTTSFTTSFSTAASAARGRGPLGLVCLALLCGLGAAEAEFAILEEAQVVAAQMRKLAAEELGVVTMQVRTRFPPAPLPSLPFFPPFLPLLFPLALQTFLPEGLPGSAARLQRLAPKRKRERGRLPTAPRQPRPLEGGANAVGKTSRAERETL